MLEGDRLEDRSDLSDTSFTIKPKKKNWRGILTVIGGVFLMLYLGCFFLWGNISIYVLSYFHEESPSASYDFIFLVDSMLVLSNCMGY